MQPRQRAKLGLAEALLKLGIKISSWVLFPSPPALWVLPGCLEQSLCRARVGAGGLWLERMVAEGFAEAFRVKASEKPLVKS